MWMVRGLFLVYLWNCGRTEKDWIVYGGFEFRWGFPKLAPPCMHPKAQLFLANELEEDLDELRLFGQVDGRSDERMDGILNYEPPYAREEEVEDRIIKRIVRAKVNAGLKPSTAQAIVERKLETYYLRRSLRKLQTLRMGTQKTLNEFREMMMD
ncbi:hypothetical protein EAF04_001422 [Stromatinia cepivora]|nr:hypothetical protein EAF04_001422 [Stromatinia cepivora]